MVYNKFTGEEYIDTELVPKLNDNFDAVRSGNAGTNFPMTDLVVGMKFFDITTQKEWTLVGTNPVTWKKLGGTLIRRFFTASEWVKVGTGQTYYLSIGTSQLTITAVAAKVGSSYKNILIDIEETKLSAISAFDGYVDYTEYNKEER